VVTDVISAMQRAIEAMNRWPQQTVQILHHNDADGLSSGAVLTRAFERKGYKIKRFCLEKTYPVILQKVLGQKGKLIVFADFAGRIAPRISELNQGKNLVLILDHHKAMPATDSRVFNLDPELYGLKGDRDITASTTCYLFAKTMDASNRDLAHIAAIGAVGDHFYVDGRLASCNRDVVLAAQRQNLMDILAHEKGEEYMMLTPGGPISCEVLGRYLDTLGAAGYYQNGPDMGITVCLQGISRESDNMVEKLRKIQNQIFTEQMRRIQTGALKHTKHIQWFHVQHGFHPMGVKMIGTFCNHYKNTEVFKPDTYIAGFQIIPDNIPGFGRIDLNEVKISMRVSSKLAAEIRAGRAAGLDTFLPEATHRVGGFSDACHSLAAATTLPIGKEEDLITEMEKILSKTSLT